MSSFGRHKVLAKRQRRRRQRACEERRAMLVPRRSYYARVRGRTLLAIESYADVIGIITGMRLFG